jgi:RNA polymerase sigma factor (sigma-70 family)
LGTVIEAAGNIWVMSESAEGPESDAKLIEASIDTPESFSLLFTRHAGGLHRYMVKRVGRAPAEDLVGDTFVTAFQSRDRYDLGIADARPWLFGIATNLARHYWRSEERRFERERVAAATVNKAEDVSETAISNAFFHDQAEPIAHALAQIDDLYLDVLLLVAGPGFSYDEVALALGIPVGTVRSRLSRGRQQLRELLGRSGQYLDAAPETERPSISTEGSP